MTGQNNLTDNLKVSVVFTVLNEGSNICNVISSLLGQTRKPDEIVICDGGSKDDTVLQVQQLISNEVPLRIIEAKGACRGAGRNRAIEAAANSIVALIDAGTVAEPQWLEQLLSPCICDSSVDIVYGAVLPKVKDRFTRCLAALVIGSSSHIEGRFYPSVASLLLRKRVWHLTGGFPEGLSTAEDHVFIDRLSTFKASSVRVEDAVVNWHLPASLSAVFRRYSVYSRGSLVAGFARRWHYGTLRNLSIFVFLTCSGIFIHPWLFIGLLFFQILRVHKNLILNKTPWIRHCSFFGKVGDYIITTIILATMDIATIKGLLQWIILDRCHKKKITRINQ